MYLKRMRCADKTWSGIWQETNLDAWERAVQARRDLNPIYAIQMGYKWNRLQRIGTE
jgi:hypothetical protein